VLSAIFLPVESVHAAAEQKVVDRIQLPTAEILNKRLSDAELQDFVEKTRLDKQLGGTVWLWSAIPKIMRTIQDELLQYNRLAKSPYNSFIQALSLQPKISELVLQDYPGILAKLKEANILDVSFDGINKTNYQLLGKYFSQAQSGTP